MRTTTATDKFVQEKLFMVSDAREQAWDTGVALPVQIKCRQAFGRGLRTQVLGNYALGESLPDLSARVVAGLHDMQACSRFIAEHDPKAFAGMFHANSSAALKECLGLWALCVTLVDRRDDLRLLPPLVSQDPPGSLWHALVAPFVPPAEGADAPTYSIEPYPWAQGLAEVIALPREAMAAALAGYLQRWPALMLPLGLNPRDPGRFMDFAFEAALVVCAWDLDDGAFRASPFYPADLVDHYRTHVRSTRDAGFHAGAGLAPGAGLPSAKRRIDIAGAGLEGLPLWVAQVVRGDEAAIALAANAANCDGALASLLGGLAMAGYAVHADIKDDVEVESQLAALLAEAGLAGFVPPARPAAGPARCSELLTAAGRWVAERGQVLAEVDLGDDAWHAVLVPQDSVQPWLALGRALGMQLRTGDAAFRG